MDKCQNIFDTVVSLTSVSTLLDPAFTLTYLILIRQLCGNKHLLREHIYQVHRYQVHRSDNGPWEISQYVKGLFSASRLFL